jgi:membrane protease YdiL (CAAX protease family)
MKNTLIISSLLLLGGTAVFVLGNPYYSVFPTNGNRTYYIVLTTFFLITSVLLKRNQALTVYTPALYALFIASAALLFLDTGVLNLHDNDMVPLKFLAFDKLSQFLHIVPVIIILTLLAKGSLKSIFIGVGNLKLGLIFGLVSLTVFAVLALIMGVQSSRFFPSLWQALPWILLWIFANSIMEELWFRGIFLRPYENIIGQNAAIVVTALIFGISHINATYEFPGGGFVFGLVVFILGLAGAYMMFKSDSLIGPVLFHAGYDLLVIVPVLNTV